MLPLVLPPLPLVLRLPLVAQLTPPRLLLTPPLQRSRSPDRQTGSSLFEPDAAVRWHFFWEIHTVIQAVPAC